MELSEMEFSVSVIIPAYNVESYIKESIASVLTNSEVKEILIIDDGSEDETLSIAAQLAKENNIIKVLRHSDGKNRGRSASRNLGIVNARCQYIAFLDADDVFCMNRFDVDKKIFTGRTDVDAVYNAIGSFDDDGQGHYIYNNRIFTTTIKKIDPSDLFFNMDPIGECGYFSGIGLTVKREFFKTVGMFNENLSVTEDTNLWVKMAALGTLLPGELNQATALRRIYVRAKEPREIEFNRMYPEMWKDWAWWILEQSLSDKHFLSVYREYMFLLSTRETLEIVEVKNLIVKAVKKYPLLLFNFEFLKPLFKLNFKKGMKALFRI